MMLQMARFETGSLGYEERENRKKKATQRGHFNIFLPTISMHPAFFIRFNAFEGFMNGDSVEVFSVHRVSLLRLPFHG